MKIIKKTFKAVEWCPYCVNEADESGNEFYRGGFYGHGTCERCGQEDDLATCLWGVDDDEQ